MLHGYVFIRVVVSGEYRSSIHRPSPLSTCAPLKHDFKKVVGERLSRVDKAEAEWSHLFKDHEAQALASLVFTYPWERDALMASLITTPIK